MDIDFARPFFGKEEKAAVNRVLEGHWLANGPENEAFEREFAEYIGVPYALAVNSGSSANLLALASLNLPKGYPVLTSGCGFPATLSPILHLGLEPVLVDYSVTTLNLTMERAESRIKSCTAAIVAHTLGVPADIRGLVESGVPVIEDCCEAIGATLGGKQVGSIGDIGTFSFYPSHQITALGGGGMVTFKKEEHYVRAKSLRDWGKLGTGYGRSNTSYNVKVGELDYFPHYVYSTVGWNFKLPEANAAFGRVQLGRLPYIVAQRKANRDYIAAAIGNDGVLKHSVPLDAEPSWFGVPMVFTRYDRNKVGDALEAAGVRHRPFFAGNITKHPPFAHMKANLPGADFLMRNALFFGCYAGMTKAELDYVIEAVNSALR